MQGGGATVLAAALGAACCAQAGVGEAAAYSARTGGTALLVRERGRTVFECYAPGWQPHMAAPVFSVTKSLCALAVLAAIGDGLMDAGAGLPGGLTVRGLLTQTSGLPPASAQIYGRRNAAVAARLQPVGAGGFAYGPSHYEALAGHLERRLAVGPAGPGHYVARRILEPIGITEADWSRDRRGAVYFSTGLRASPRALARAGEMVIAGGRVGWRQVVPRRWLEEALRGTDANPAYGMGFWLNAASKREGSIEGDIEQALARGSGWGRFCLSHAAPPDLVAMAGSRGQRIYMVPSRKLVIVRLGDAGGFRDDAFLRAFFGG